MTPVETQVFDFLTEKAVGHPAFAAGKIYDNPHRNLDQATTTGVWVGFAAGEMVQKAATEIINAVLVLAVRSFIAHRDTTERAEALQKATDVSAAIFGWFDQSRTMSGRVCDAIVLGFDNGGDVMDGQEYAGANIYLAVNPENVSTAELLGRAKRTVS
ncbi:MAG TPA: hypothetical protein VNI84_08675 [Pyrinomonadaceae bacterium]|nr:hypothetical protein [Pyrinomonadaceae bacterium]